MSLHTTARLCYQQGSEVFYVTPTSTAPFGETNSSRDAIACVVGGPQKYRGIAYVDNEAAGGRVMRQTGLCVRVEDAAEKVRALIDAQEKINEELRTNPLERLKVLCVGHDWYYAMSDDPRVYRRGTESERRINDLARRVEGGKEVVSHYRKKNQTNRRM